MKLILVCLSLFLLHQNGFTQKGARYIAQDDPLVGDWIFSTDSTAKNSTAPLFGGAEVISLLPGLEVCMIAKKQGEKIHYDKATYFTAKIDVKTIYCDISEALAAPSLAGTSFNMNYEYHCETDTLVVILNGKKYFYSRKK